MRKILPIELQKWIIYFEMNLYLKLKFRTLCFTEDDVTNREENVEITSTGFQILNSSLRIKKRICNDTKQD